MIYIFIIISLTAIDQITKYMIYEESLGIVGYSIPIISNFFHITYIENHGGIFGLFQGRINVFTAVSTLLIIYIVATEYKNFNKYSKLTKIGISIIAAGALGNMIDRFFRGYVIDMIDIQGIWPFIFNVADMYIHIGVYLILIDQFILKNYLKNLSKKNSKINKKR